MKPTSSKLGFTLVELMVVVAIMSMAVGLAVFRMDGLSQGARVRSATTQLASVVRHTSQQARVLGEPRLIEINVEASEFTVRTPKRRAEGWAWDEGAAFDLGQIEVVTVYPEGDQADGQSDAWTIRVDASGRFKAHAIVLSTPDRSSFGVAILRVRQTPRYAWLNKAPQSRTFELLLLELENLRASA